MITPHPDLVFVDRTDSHLVSHKKHKTEHQPHCRTPGKIATATLSTGVGKGGERRPKRWPKSFPAWNKVHGVPPARVPDECTPFERPLYGSRPTGSSTLAGSDTRIFLSSCRERLRIAAIVRCKLLTGSRTRHRSYLIVPSVFTFSYDRRTQLPCISEQHRPRVCSTDNMTEK